MQHESCAVAIKKLNEIGSNVKIDSSECKCPHNPTPCDWSGNTMYYACLNTPGYNAPQKVYTTMSGGGNGRIILDSKQNEK